eukprot:g2885.t1
MMLRTSRNGRCVSRALCTEASKLVTTTDADVNHQISLDLPLAGLPVLKPASELETPDVITSALPNGLRIASQETYGQAVTLGMFIGVGSRHESAANNGSTHLFEHMAFKGTSKRSHAEIVQEIEDMGAVVNACAAREHLVFSIDVLRDNLEGALELLADSLTDPIISTDELEHQKLIVNIEREELEQNPQMLVTEEIHSAAYGSTSPLGRPLFCPAHNFGQISPSSLQDFMDMHFTAPKMEVLNTHYWVESCQAFTNIHSDAGMIGIFGSADPSYLGHLTAVLVGQMRRVADEKVDVIELVRARNQLKSSVLMNLESRSILFEDIGRQILTYGERESAESICEKIDAVTVDDIMRVGQRAISSVPTIVSYGNLRHMPDYDLVANYLR